MGYSSVEVTPVELEQGLRSNHPDLKPFIRNCIRLGYSNERIYTLCNVPHKMIDDVRSEVNREKAKLEKSK